MLETGTEAPECTLKNQHGDSVSLAAFETVAVYFYPRADTPGCTTEACEFRDSWADFEERGIDVVGISDDPVSDLESFSEEYDLPFDLLSDPDGEVAAAYDSYGEKNMFGNTFEGVFRNTYVVSDGEIVAAYEGVSPEGHAGEILSDFDY